MPRLSDVNWASITSSSDGTYFLWALAYIGIVFALGVIELFMHKTSWPGLTTWAFALPGLIAVPVVIAMDDGLNVLLRILFVLGWLLFFGWAFRFAYRKAQERHKADSSNPTMPM